MKVYLNDVVFFLKNLDEHVEHIQKVVSLVTKHGLKLKASKCEVAKKSVVSLGLIVDKEGMRVDTSNVEAIQETPRPAIRTEIGSFLGIARYFRRFIRSFASILISLHAMTSGKSKFVWTDEMNQVFETLKQALTSPPVFALPNFDQPFDAERTHLQ